MSESFLIKIVEAFPWIFGKVEDIAEKTLNQWHYLLRKVAHFLEYTVLGIFMHMTFSETKCRRKVLTCAIACVLIAMSDEVLQLFVPERAGRCMDILIDSCGAITGIFLVRLIKNALSCFKLKKGEKIQKT
jgi:VanZ family protein